MQDDNNNNNAGHQEATPIQSKEEATLAAEREALLKQRRDRQTGTAGGGRRAGVMAVALLGGSGFLLFALVGSNGIMKALGLGNGDGPGTSSVNMEVDRPKGETSRLDFIVPAAPEPPKEKPVDPNEAWTARFKEMQDKIAQMEKRKQGMSAADVKQLLASYNDTMAKKLEEERKAMAEENARLRLQAQQAEEARRRAEEQARLNAASTKEQQKIDKMQRESRSVIVDEANKSAIGENGLPLADNLADLDQNERFLKSAAASVVQASVSQKLADPSRMVVQGTIISAVLETAVDTQLPGNIRAQVIRSVYSFDGSRVVMPPGTILVGQFNNDVNLDQKRVLIAWNRAITPDGKSITLGSTGTDTLGRAGTLGNVDNRYRTKFGAALLISAINAVPTALSQSNRSRGSGSSGTTINVGGQLASNAGSDLSAQTSGVMEKYLSLPPIVRIPQGEEIRVFVNRDLLFR